MGSGGSGRANRRTTDELARTVLSMGMGRIQTYVVSGVVAAVFGFGGAVGAMAAFHDDFRGEQGATGLQGPPGEQGPPGTDGADGIDGHDGARGPRGRAGKAADDPAPQSVDLGSDGCAGAPVEVVTDVAVVKQRLQLTKSNVCVTGGS